MGIRFGSLMETFVAFEIAESRRDSEEEEQWESVSDSDEGEPSSEDFEGDLEGPKFVKRRRVFWVFVGIINEECPARLRKQI